MSNSARGRKGGGPKHKSIEALLAAYPGESDPKALIRRLAREKVVYAKSKQWTGPPYCPKIFSSIFGIRCKEVEHEIGGEGRLLLYPDGKPWIEYRKGRMEERQRFTIFHEFAHTLFPDYCRFVPHNHSPDGDVADPDKPFEHLCDLGASEILLPLEDFRTDLVKAEWLGFETVHSLRERYRASIDATTYRLVEVASDLPCAAVFLTDQRQDHPGRGPLWVKNTANSRAFKSFIRAGITPPWDSVTIHCYRNGPEISRPAKETWWINGKPRSWLVQAAKLPRIADDPNYPKVVALLFPSSYGKKWRPLLTQGSLSESPSSSND